MGLSFKHWSGGIALATLLLAGQGLAVAQEVDPSEQPLHQSTISETLDRQSNLDSYWADEDLGGDANFAFSVETPEGVIRDSAERIEVIYKDLLQQQDDDFPTVRTRDLANPYATSLLELQSLSGIGNSEPAPASQYIPQAAPAVPALW
ncbi:hypothetical protein [Acaryochloris sp. IP29b_bin.137]|uniref:hypothetical protein n=1 Tax=Acaryochloris sp. IP29b_bin.137 TaxID=2969217 RepID=UPI00260286D6|nr:hypothetical protein [Acaryochloris sp. IP29b_bin.137]